MVFIVPTKTAETHADIYPWNLMLKHILIIIKEVNKHVTIFTQNSGVSEKRVKGPHNICVGWVINTDYMQIPEQYYCTKYLNSKPSFLIYQHLYVITLISPDLQGC